MIDIKPGQSKLRVSSFFSGIGGFELGLARAGHKPILFCENDLFARAVLARHYPRVPLLNDIREVDHVPECDLLTAGWPCQDLSLAGRTQGVSGSRSSLIEEVFRIVKKSTVKPRFILLENVAFAVDLHNGRALASVVSQLEELGYSWAYRVLDTKCFGLPQRRRRLFILAALDVRPENILFDGIQSAGLNEDASPSVVGFYWTEGTRGTGWSPEATPPLKGGSALGIPSPPAVWDMQRGLFLKPGIEDAERLQGFPVNWTRVAEEFRGGKGRRWVLVGNAVSVPVAEWLGSRLTGLGNNAAFSDEVISRTDRWPRAAYGGGGIVSQAVRATNEGPPNPIRSRLSDFGLVSATALSQRAISGFSKRFQASALKKSPSFIAALNASLQSGVTV